MMDTMKRLSGRRIAVTGANRGIGRALVEAFVGEGAHVCAHARSGADAEALQASLEALDGDGELAVVAGDLRDPTLGERLFRAAQEELQGLDVLVLNAGILGERVPLAEADLGVFREVMTVNVDSQVRLVQALLPALRTSRGAIIWLTSALGHEAYPRYGAYCASKHAVEGLAKLVAVEHEADGIVSVAVAPGMVQTEMLRAAMDGGDISEHMAPDAAAEGFVELIRQLGADLNGRVVDIADWL